jgi:hypothetical protein
MITRRTAGYLVWVVLMAIAFAKVEIQIEGAAGWAASLPTWRIEKHWLLDIFWGSRPMTGYHAWVFTFMALSFLAPLAFNGGWARRDLLLGLAGLMLFWVAEDFLWFLLNPSYGWVGFDPAHVPWHKRWWWGAPVDYWLGLGGVALLLRVRAVSARKANDPASSGS